MNLIKGWGKHFGVNSSIVLILAILAVIGLVLVGFRATASDDCTFSDSIKTQSGLCITLKRADTNDSRSKGLSGITDLLPDHGMLFVFDEAEEACMWMKDMKFSLDIVWLDLNQKIVKIEENISPETYPKSYCSDEPAKYVIELNAGVTRQAGFKTGQLLEL